MSIITSADSYKFSQYAMYPEGTEEMFGYISGRVPGQTLIPFGLSMWIQSKLMVPITIEDIEEAEQVAKMHGEPFNRADWEYILIAHGGYIPVEIMSVPEGTPVASDEAFVTIRSTDPLVPWVGSYLESTMQRGIWYPTTIASQGYAHYKQLKYFYDNQSDNPGGLAFALNDFGNRGATSEESAAIGGLGHLVFFQGTDNIPAIMAARKYYGCEMAGFSVPASEHSVQCAYGKDGAVEYIGRMLDLYAKPGAIVSIVLDGYDVYREVNLICTYFRERILKSGATVVCRPDSGDMFEVVPRILGMLDTAFGHTLNSRGRRVLNSVKIIQGDGIDATSLGMLAQRVSDLGYAPESVIYGSGGGLLQRVTRDTYKFAMKTSAIKINGRWQDVVKDPITDSGKRSLAGQITNPEFEVVYRNGKHFAKPTLAEIRARAMK